MTKEELKKEAEEKAKKRTKGFACQDNCEKSYVMGALDFAEIEKMKCLNEEIIKALKESNDYEWLLAHNGQAKYMYLQTVIDIVNEKFEEIKEK